MPGNSTGQSVFGYTVGDPAGNAASGSVTVTVGLPVVTPAPTLGFVLPGLASPVLRAITDLAAPTLSGTAAPGATITLSGGLGTVVAGANGAWSISLPTQMVPTTGLLLSVTATAMLPGTAASAASPVVTLLILPQADATGTIVADLSSDDIGPLLSTNYPLFLTPSVEAIRLVDGTLSVGPDTAEAFLARLYQGLYGRAADAAGIAAWDGLVAAGVSQVTIAADFMALPEFQVRMGGLGEASIVATLFQGFLGRAPTADELSFVLAPATQALGNAQIVVDLANLPGAKSYLAPSTARVWARDPLGTTVHELYETGIGREVDLPALAGWKQFLATEGLTVVASQILATAIADGELAGLESDTSFVTALYQHALGRAPNPAEQSAMLGWLQSGVTTRGGLLAAAVSLPGTGQHLTTDQFTGATPSSYTLAPIVPPVTPADPPGPSATGGTTAVQGLPTSITFVGENPVTGAPVTGWAVSWGDGTAPDTLDASAAGDTHTFALPGTYQVSVVGQTADGPSFAAPLLTEQVAAATLAATGIAAESTGFHARFNGVLDPSTVLRHRQRWRRSQRAADRTGGRRHPWHHRAGH